MSKKMSRKILGYISLALVCVMAGTVIGMSVLSAEAETVIVTSPFTEAIAKVRDSVVGVNNYQIVNNYGNSYGYGYGYGFGYGSPFGFGGNGGYGNGGNQPYSGQEIKYGSGSGVVIEKEYVLTNYHVIEDASSLKVSLGDENDTQYDATVAAYDATKDVAVLYVPGLEVEPVALGDSDSLQVGDWVVNIGNAIGFTRTATAGIVSALDREIESDSTTTDRYGRRSTVTNTMIQTDAAINSGNSGGGMFNTAGELVGIPTLKYSGSRYNGASIESIGMCIPINEAKPVIEEALNGKKTSADAGTQPKVNSAEAQTGNDLLGQPRLGVVVATLNGSEQTGGLLPNGAYIITVEDNSPAEKAGLKPGDVLVDFNDHVIASSDDLIKEMKGRKDGEVVTVKVWRPREVYNAERGSFSYEGSYVQDIQVTLEILEQDTEAANS